MQMLASLDFQFLGSGSLSPIHDDSVGIIVIVLLHRQCAGACISASVNMPFVETRVMKAPCLTIWSPCTNANTPEVGPHHHGTLHFKQRAQCTARLMCCSHLLWLCEQFPLHDAPQEITLESPSDPCCTLAKQLTMLQHLLKCGGLRQHFSEYAICGD